MTITPASLAAAMIVAALERACAHVPVEVRPELQRALLVARESGVLVTPDGEPLLDLLTELHEKMVIPSSKKASEPWQRALKARHVPRYRIDFGTPKACDAGVVTMTDTATGAQRRFTGEQAENMRDVFRNTDTGAAETNAGIGVCGLHEELAAELLEKPDA